MTGIELFKARLFRHTFAEHFHEAYTIGINDGGQGAFAYRGAIHYNCPGSFNLINPGELHTGQAISSVGWSFRNLYIEVPLIERSLEQLEWSDQGLPFFRKPVISDRNLYADFSRLFQALSAPTSQLAQQSLLLTVLAQLFLRHAESRYQLSSPQSEPRAIAQIRAYLEAHYAENVSIEALANLVGLSPYYLIRSFHQAVGLPPHRYQRHWQLRQAKQALRSPQPISEIALEHGFYDQSHLTRHFKRVFGVTPGQYRQSNFVQDR